MYIIIYIYIIEYDVYLLRYITIIYIYTHIHLKLWYDVYDHTLYPLESTASDHPLRPFVSRHDAGASHANAGDQGPAGTGQESPGGDAAQQQRVSDTRSYGEPWGWHVDIYIYIYEMLIGYECVWDGMAIYVSIYYTL